MQRKITGWNPIGYKKRNKKQFKKLTKLISNLDGSKDVEEGTCNGEVRMFFNKTVVRFVKDAINTCGF
jgi:hypothetical protein